MERTSLPVELPDEAVDAVIDALLQAGKVVARSYNEDEGWDLIAFGAVLWRLSWNNIERTLREAGYTTWYEENSLRAQISGYRCSFYSLGDSSSTSAYDYDFGRTPKRKEAASANQMRLFTVVSVPDEPGDLAAFRDLHFVYCGDPRRGVAAVHVGAPILEDKTPRWAWVRTIYRTEDVVAEQEPTDAGWQFAAYIDQPDVELVVKPRSATTRATRGDSA